MSAADNILKNYQLFVDGRGYAGNCPQLTLPKVKVKTEDFQAGGLDAPIGIDMGTEKMEANFELSKFDPDALKLWGLFNSNPPAIVARGAMQSQDGSVIPVVATMKGPVREVDFGDWKPAAISSTKYNCEAQYFKLEVNGATVIEIDVPNMVRKVNGTDQLQAIRTAIGM